MDKSVMKAGRDLDKLIGEKVLQLDGWYLADEFLPHFSTSMDAAWLIVEKMPYLDNGLDSPYHKFREELAWLTIYQITPERICLAALKAVGVDKFV